MKPIFDNLPDLDEAFEAVKGQLFGPLDPALVRLKHKEIVHEAKEKREQASIRADGLALRATISRSGIVKIAKRTPERSPGCWRMTARTGNPMGGH